MAWVSGRYAIRSVRRNIRRTALSILGIAIGCVLALFMESLNRGRDELFARAGAYTGAGHVRVVPAGWRSRRDIRLRLGDWRRDLAAARGASGVVAATPRGRADVLIAMGTHVVPVELVGVDPVTEPTTNRFVRVVQRGRYLRADDEGAIVLGQAIASRLSADVDDDLLASVVARSGNIESAMFHIVGVVRTGSEDMDLSVAQVSIDDLSRLTGLEGVGEVAIVLADWRRASALRSELAPALAPGDEAMTWEEIYPDFKGHMEQDTASARVVSAIILLIVLLGVMSAELASVLERRREFAVLSAIGMSATTMVWLVVEEAVALGVAGGALGLAVGAPIIWQFAAHGLDFRRYLGSYAFAGTLIDPVIYGDFGWWIVPYVFVVAIGATVVASLYPARFATRTDPAVALRVAQ